MLDYHVGTMAVVDRFAETRLNLFGYVEVVENWNFTRIEFYDVRFFRGYKRHVVFYFLINIFVVDVDVLITWVEQVSQKRYGTAGFFKHKLGSFLRLLHLCYGVLPALGKHLQLSIQFSHSLTFGYRSHNNSTVLRLNAMYKLLESCSLFSRLYFGRYRDLVAEWHKHKISSGKRDFACQSRTFGRNGFFYNLHQHLIAHFERSLYAAVFRDIGQT